MTFPQVQLLGFAVVALSAVAFAVGERRYPYNAGQRLFREGFWTDLLLYNVLQSYVLGVLIGQFLSRLDATTNLSRHGWLRGWPLPLQLLFFVVTHDLYIYVFHGWMHRSPWLWRLHEAHHSAREVDWLSGVRSHAFEILINQTVEFAPIVLLGAAPAVAVGKGVVSAVWGMFIHANLDVRLGRLQRLINGPEMHRWHHSTQPDAQAKNFSTKLAIWDWLFGTAFFPDPHRRKASGYGLVDERFPRGYVGQQLYAFRPLHEASGSTAVGEVA
ncbi:MAG TPA: sterol desaturase family protein [Thermoanaerobaculia bacterium]|nr:sterol desaturase family protein [Thermoanaerobaculia bacterium]